MPKRNEKYRRIKEYPGFIRSDAGALALFVSLVTEKNVSQSFISLGLGKCLSDRDSKKYEYRGKYKEETFLEAIEMRRKGLKWKEIGERLGIDYNIIRACVSRYLKNINK